MSNFSDCIIEMLRASPNGLTSKDIAERLGKTAANISSRLSKLAGYGIISKTRGSLVRGTIYQAPSDDPRSPRKAIGAASPMPDNTGAESFQRGVLAII
ncbi:MAG: hypothetical protein QOI40_414 [Alphaproteobacteria bacterium]|nr:hypothetical protein [Alphaproteobacteria bacterium]